MFSRAFKGLIAESFACLLLRLKGYSIFARRFECKSGEIDIVAWKKECLIAVEVKYRQQRKTALECISPVQQSRIKNALLIFLQKKRLGKSDLRLDVIVFYKTGWEHIKNAF